MRAGVMDRRQRLPVEARVDLRRVEVELHETRAEGLEHPVRILLAMCESEMGEIGNVHESACVALECAVVNLQPPQVGQNGPENTGLHDFAPTMLVCRSAVDDERSQGNG